MKPFAATAHLGYVERPVARRVHTYAHAPECNCPSCKPGQAPRNNEGARASARPVTKPKPAQKAAAKSKPRSAPAKRSSAKVAKR